MTMMQNNTLVKSIIMNEYLGTYSLGSLNWTTLLRVAGGIESCKRNIATITLS